MSETQKADNQGYRFLLFDRVHYHASQSPFSSQVNSLLLCAAATPAVVSSRPGTADALLARPRFHDPAGQSVFANSSSVGAFDQWSAAQSQSGTSSPAPVRDVGDPLVIRVETSTGPVYLPSLVTPRFAQGKRIRYAIYEYESLIDSSEIEPSDWINIATDIERNYQSFDGFIVLHGTDTLAFSASALSFLLVRGRVTHSVSFATLIHCHR